MYKLITIDVSSGTVKPLGAKQYQALPRIGEWVEMELNEIGIMFEVVMVAHSDSGDGSDIYVKFLGKTDEVIKSICKPSA